MFVSYEERIKNNADVLLNRKTYYKVLPPSGDRISVEYTLKADNQEPVRLEYRLVTMHEVIGMVSRGDAVALDFCYIKDFDFSVVQNHLKEKHVAIQSFSAVCAFFDGNVSFSGATFGEGPVSFTQTQFADGVISFENASFSSGPVDFNRARLGDGDVHFTGVDFGHSPVAFNGTQFGDGDIWFNNARFGSGHISFQKTQFGNGNVFFDQANFGQGGMTFADAQFGEGGITFCGASVVDGGMVQFNNTHFGRGYTAFAGLTGPRATFTFHRCSFLNHEDFRFQNIGELNIHDCIIGGTFDMQGSDAEPVHVGVLSMANTKNTGNMYVHWQTLQSALLQNNQKDGCASKADQLKMLKENYRNIGEYDWEDKAFVAYMRQNRRGASPWNAWVKLWHLVIDGIGEYGTNPKRILLVMLVVWFIFGCIFAASVAQFNMAQPSLHPGNGFYFSAITFLTIGYGDIAPVTALMRVLASLEGFLGLFFMSYFTVAIVRKTLR